MLKDELECGWNGAKSSLYGQANTFDIIMAAWCTIILVVWIWLLRYLYRTYNEFYVLLEQIYSGEYFKNQQNGGNSGSGNETPATATANDDDGEIEAECIELDTFEQNDDDDNDNNVNNNNNNDDNENDNDNDNSIDNSNQDNDK